MHRCNLNISVMSPWYEEHLGVCANASSEERLARVNEVFPGLITYDYPSASPYAPDPNGGCTVHTALGARLVEAEDRVGGHEVVPMSIEEIEAMDVPDYATSEPVQALRASIRQTKSRFGRAVSGGFSGVFAAALKLRGNDIFYDFYERPDFVHRMADVISATMYKHIEFPMDECGEIPYFVLGSCPNCMIRPDIYDEFFREGEARIASLSTRVKGHQRAMGIHHCGTKLDPYYGAYSKIPELLMLEGNYLSDMKLGSRMIPGIQFKPMLDPIEFDSFSVETIRGIMSGLLHNECVEEIQAFDMSQSFTVDKIRAMLETVVEFNRSEGLPGYTRWFA
jgi:hypothetical protein